MHFVRFWTYIASCFSVVRAFSVTVGTPTQCDPLNISWTGKRISSTFYILPLNFIGISLEPYQNYSVPASAFSNGKGSYSISQLLLSTGTSFLLTMSDATGFASGGTTNQLIVGNTVANNNCSTAVLSPPYTFQLSPLPLTQCSQFTFVADSGAVLPITIVQLIPGGQPVVFNSNSDTFTSVVDVHQGTNLVYFVTDSEGRQGGVSGFEQVLGSSNSSCLSANSPSSTAGISATSTASPTSSSSSPSSSSSGSPSQSNVAVIAGAVGGGGAVLIALVIFGMCLWRKRRASRSLDVQSPTTSHLQRTDPKYEASPYSDIPSPFTFPYQTNPLSYHTRSIQPSLGTQSDLTNSSMSNFVAGAPPSSFNQIQHSRQSSNADSAVYGDARSSTMSSAYNRMAALSQPMSADYPAQYPAGYLPVRPGSQSPPLSTSTGNFAANDRPTLHSRQSSNADSAAYGDARSSAAMSSVDRRMTTVAEAWETNPVSHLGLPIQSGSQPNLVDAPAADLTARDLLPTAFNQTQPSSNTNFAVYGDARISDMTPVEHMAAGARSASPLPRKTVPVYITPPVQPGSQSISTSAVKVALSNPSTPFNQTQNSRQSPNADSSAVYGASGGQPPQRGPGQTAYQLPTRIIVHTDADDVVPDDNGLVELPPQYSDHRGVRA
ncbi:hypothetical protein DFJ58DRAFT_778309 [Suillus subalutaceus]|uniref:uncharacterized protein n=1 Tax=Suillus subalutaceus TaxID=48586 RepID=UPI001B870D9C|nr:uncharacterized protein DFJ58DRAFT_778309 [Suillus subalutaceus]KAG1860640.1 hypothetical protein DFJ58DRAFT_778309 [Suillus subalutaceus]